MRAGRGWALLIIALTGCGQVGLVTRWAPEHFLKYDAAHYPDDAAVGLYAEDGVLLTYRTANDKTTQHLVHRVWAIQNEKAFALSEVRIVMGGNSRLISLIARHRRADGTIVELRPNEVIADETSGDPEKGVVGRVFRFSDVQKGSVLEWAYVIERPSLELTGDSESLGEYPLRHYEASVEATNGIILHQRFYNLHAHAEAGPGAGRDTSRISIAGDDLPSRPKHEAFAPDWTFTEPRWAYRMLRWNFEGHTVPVFETWNDVITPWAWRAWGEGKESLFAGFDARVDVVGCTDARCRVKRALRLVREQTAYAGIGSFREMRKMDEVWRSREATSFERGVLLRKLLGDAGVNASLAAYTARTTSQIDPEFPTTSVLNRLLVVVPGEGLERLWVDPSCEACSLGQVSDEARDADAIVFRARGPNSELVFTSEHTGVEAQVLAPPSRVTTHEATVFLSGDVRLETSQDLIGRFAMNRCAELRVENDDARAEVVRQQAVQLSGTARISSVDSPECDARHGTSSERFSVTLPQHAVFQGDRLFVPLTLLEGDYEETFIEERRKQPIAFENGDSRVEQRLRITVPPGFKLAKPTRETAAAPGMNATFEVVPTPEGANVTLTVDTTAGYHLAREYAAYHKVGAFLRSVRMRMLELVKQ